MNRKCLKNLMVSKYIQYVVSVVIFIGLGDFFFTFIKLSNLKKKERQIKEKKKHNVYDTLYAAIRFYQDPIHYDSSVHSLHVLLPWKKQGKNSTERYVKYDLGVFHPNPFQISPVCLFSFFYLPSSFPSNPETL